MGQFTDESGGSLVAECDPFSASVYPSWSPFTANNATTLSPIWLVEINQRLVPAASTAAAACAPIINALIFDLGRSGVGLAAFQFHFFPRRPPSAWPDTRPSP